MNSGEYSNGKNGRRHGNRSTSDTLSAVSAKCVNESFEIVSYRDSIKTINCNFLARVTGSRYFAGCQLWFVKDCCGGVCIALTWSLIVFAECIVCRILLVSFLNSIYVTSIGTLFQCLIFLAVASHLKSMFSDPGAVPRGNATRENIAKLNLCQGDIVYRCPKCVCIKPDRAHHCRVCRRCVRKMDHHCPWINNCVGEENLKYFILFTMYTCIISCIALFMAIFQLVQWWRHDWKNYQVGINPAFSVVLLVMLILEALVFGIFTGIMFTNQMWAVLTDETHIEHLKKDNRRRLSKWSAVKSVFGQKLSYRWFSPFHSGVKSSSFSGVVKDNDEAVHRVTDTDAGTDAADCIVSTIQ